jgi:hypothetical protein
MKKTLFMFGYAIREVVAPLGLHAQGAYAWSPEI